MLDYTSCMRDNGIDMPDPEFASAPGGVITKQVAGRGEEGGPAFDPTNQAFKDADAECGPLLRDAIGTIDIDPEQQAEMREQALAFSQCMRDHGVDFPDPVFDDNGGISVSIGSDDGATGPSPDDPEVEAAMEECSAVTGAPMVAGAKVGD